mmetsp:Transcript_44719/g.100201  ORF Transcript_44719/g.100201 Transcript_44719/m.100201 type:complete len:237 (+) Transcript_44719:550-1260(+)
MRIILLVLSVPLSLETISFVAVSFPVKSLAIIPEFPFSFVILSSAFSIFAVALVHVVALSVKAFAIESFAIKSFAISSFAVKPFARVKPLTFSTVRSCSPSWSYRLILPGHGHELATLVHREETVLDLLLIGRAILPGLIPMARLISSAMIVSDWFPYRISVTFLSFPFSRFAISSFPLSCVFFSLLFSLTPLALSCLARSSGSPTLADGPYALATIRVILHFVPSLLYIGLIDHG